MSSSKSCSNSSKPLNSSSHFKSLLHSNSSSHLRRGGGEKQKEPVGPKYERWDRNKLKKQSINCRAHGHERNGGSSQQKRRRWDSMPRNERRADPRMKRRHPPAFPPRRPPPSGSMAPPPPRFPTNRSHQKWNRAQRSETFCSGDPRRTVGSSALSSDGTPACKRPRLTFQQQQQQTPSCDQMPPPPPRTNFSAASIRTHSITALHNSSLQTQLPAPPPPPPLPAPIAPSTHTLPSILATTSSAQSILNPLNTNSSSTTTSSLIPNANPTTTHQPTLLSQPLLIAPHHSDQSELRNIPASATTTSSHTDSGSNVQIISPPPPNAQPQTHSHLPQATPPSTHVIFCIDFSGSMRQNDVHTNTQTEPQSRWQAVFQCADEFVKTQLEQQNDTDKANIQFSLIIFNTQARTLFRHMPLGNDGQSLRRRLKQVCASNRPRLGTDYTNAFKEMRNLILPANHAQTHHQTMAIFLSDGRPGDLRSVPPKDGEEIQHMALGMKKQRPSLVLYLDQIKHKYPGSFSLQLICIFKEGRPWMEAIAKRFHGTFHMSSLDMTIATHTNRHTHPPKNCLIHTDSHHSKELGDSHHSEHTESQTQELQIIVAKSAEQIRQENLAKAVAAGNVIEIGSSTLRNTFQNISTTLTTMTSSINTRSGALPLQERSGVVLEKFGPNSAMVEYQATRMTLNPNQPRFDVPTGETPHSRVVKVSSQPFAQGGLRNVYRMEEHPEEETDRVKMFVAKESRYRVPYAERLKFHQETSRCQSRAIQLVAEFNSKRRRVKIEPKYPDLRVLETHVYRLNDQTAPGGFRYLAVEDRLDGVYEKYNSNNGYVKDISDDSSCPAKVVRIQMAQTFSHFTYEQSKQKEMVVDIQGVGFAYTDPQLHSVSLSYGRADRGTRGFNDFFKTHKCNDYCRAMKLTSREKSAAS